MVAIWCIQEDPNLRPTMKMALLMLEGIVKVPVPPSIKGQVDVGSSLTAGANAERPWISPSGDFAFGFYQLEKRDLYLLAIWYNKIPDKTIVCYANGDDPAPRSSKVELASDRGLVLSGPQGAETWRSGISTGEATYMV